MVMTRLRKVSIGQGVGYGLGIGAGGIVLWLLLLWWWVLLLLLFMAKLLLAGKVAVSAIKVHIGGRGPDWRSSGHHGNCRRGPQGTSSDTETRTESTLGSRGAQAAGWVVVAVAEGADWNIYSSSLQTFSGCTKGREDGAAIDFGERQRRPGRVKEHAWVC